MAPRQLILPPMEDDLHPEPGSKRVRPSSDEKSSMQVQLRACASACGTHWPGPAHPGWSVGRRVVGSEEPTYGIWPDVGPYVALRNVAHITHTYIYTQHIIHLLTQSPSTRPTPDRYDRHTAVAPLRLIDPNFSVGSRRALRTIRPYVRLGLTPCVGSGDPTYRVRRPYVGPYGPSWLRTGWHCWPSPGPIARACRSWQGKTTPFTTTASAVYYNPLRRTKWTSEQFVAFKWPFSKLRKWPEPSALTTTPICIHQIVPIHIDPFEPTEAELAGDEPPSEIDMRTERQACSHPSASRATTPNGTHKKPNLHHETLADTMAQPTTLRPRP
eukprot:scaffold2761_cov148-Isochrysis_galbana.AAC.7